MLTLNYYHNIYNNMDIHTVGCELSIYDAIKFAHLKNEDNCLIFNTCSFLHEKERESKLMANLLHRAFPNKKMYILGCDVKTSNIYKKYGKVYTNEEIRQFINQKYDSELLINNSYVDIKIQDGCNKNCSYCIINQLRNSPFSESYDNIKKLINYHKNINLVGTELSNYYNQGNHLSDILRKIVNDFPNIKNIKIGSLDPSSVDIFNVIDIIGTSRKFYKNIHLSVQSGCDKILKLMKRRHNVQRIIDIHNYASQYDISIGWDLIIGFPKETEEDFLYTVSLVNKLHPCNNTIFAYSPRNGTEATSYDNQIDEKTKQMRIEQLENIISLYDNNVDTIDSNKVLDCLNNQEIIIDLNKEDDIINLLQKYPHNSQLVITTNFLSDILKSEIYINFLATYYLNSIIIVKSNKIPYDIHKFETHFKVKVIKDYNESAN